MWHTAVIQHLGDRNRRIRSSRPSSLRPLRPFQNQTDAKGGRKEKGRNHNNLKSLIGFLCISTIKHTSLHKAEVGFVDQEGQGKPGKRRKFTHCFKVTFSARWGAGSQNHRKDSRSDNVRLQPTLASLGKLAVFSQCRKTVRWHWTFAWPTPLWPLVELLDPVK